MPSMFKASACLQHSVEQGEVHSFIIIIAICLGFFHIYLLYVWPCTCIFVGVSMLQFACGIQKTTYVWELIFSSHHMGPRY